MTQITDTAPSTDHADQADHDASTHHAVQGMPSESLTSAAEAEPSAATGAASGAPDLDGTQAADGAQGERRPDRVQNGRRPAGAGKRNNRRLPAVAQQAQPTAHPARTVNPVLERLFELYPQLFGAHFLPLKLGVFHDLLQRHPDDFKKDELKLAMGQHARSTRYLESVAAGHPRHDLDGKVVEPVAPEHVHHAILEIFRRRQGRTRQDLRPGLVQRLMQAVEDSGLSRDAYAERVRVQDEATNALLDDALAELRVQAAKREALVRAFNASGKTTAEFADMYGMKLAEVDGVLERVKSDQDQLALEHAAAKATEDELAAAGSEATEGSVLPATDSDADRVA